MRPSEHSEEKVRLADDHDHNVQKIQRWSLITGMQCMDMPQQETLQPGNDCPVQCQ